VCIDLINPFLHVPLLLSRIRPYCYPSYDYPFYFSLITVNRRRTLSSTGSPSRTSQRFSKIYSLSVPLALSPSTRLAHGILLYNPSRLASTKQAIIDHWDGPTLLYGFLSVCVPSPRAFRYARHDLLPRVLTLSGTWPLLSFLSLLLTFELTSVDSPPMLQG